MTQRDQVLIKIDGLVIGFPAKPLMPQLNSTVLRGELISVIGHNGVGKSTLLRTIAGAGKRLKGEILIEGMEISEMDRKRFASLVGYISTEAVNASNMRVFDLVALGRFTYTNWLGTLSNNDRRMVDNAIEMVGLTALTNRYVNELSDGERQRAMIARLLAQDTDILVLDEPTAFLDIRNRHEILHLLHKLSQTRQKTIIMSTHDFPSAITESDRIWLLTSDGLIEGAPEDLILNGAFDLMFGEETVRFRKADGNFFPVRENRGGVCLLGDGLKKLWTSRALSRIGYDSKAPESACQLTVTCNDNNKEGWTIKSDEGQFTFNSLYDLVRYIRSVI